MNKLSFFWRRRLVVPVIALLKQGITPEKLAQTLGASFVCSMFPLIGTTSVLNLLVGLRLKLNHPLMQTLNQVLAPVHVVMILVYVRLGEWIWRAHEDPLTIADVLDIFRRLSWHEILDQFGWAMLHALTAWAITAPVIFAVIYYPCRQVFFAAVARRRHIRACLQN